MSSYNKDLEKAHAYAKTLTEEKKRKKTNWKAKDKSWSNLQKASAPYESKERGPMIQYIYGNNAFASVSAGDNAIIARGNAIGSGDAK